MGQVLRSHVDEVSLRGVTMLPVDGVARLICKALKLADGLGQHRGVVGRVDYPIAPLISFEKRRRQAVVAKPTAAFPSCCFCNRPCLLAVDHLCHAWNDVCMAVFAKLDHEPATAHLVRHNAGSAGASE